MHIAVVGESQTLAQYKIQSRAASKCIYLSICSARSPIGCVTDSVWAKLLTANKPSSCIQILVPRLSTFLALRTDTNSLTDIIFSRGCFSCKR